MSRRCPFVRAAFVLALTFVLAVPATAQERLFARTGNSIVEVDTSTTRFGEVLRTWPLAPGRRIGAPAAVTGGRYLVWLAVHAATPETDQPRLDLEVFDTITGSVSSLMLGWGLFSGRILGANAEGDELTLLSYGVEAGWQVTTGNVRTLQARTYPLPFGPCYDNYALATEARVLFALRHVQCGFIPGGPQFVDIIDLRDGTITERAFEVPFSLGQTAAANAAGTRLWIGVTQPGFEALIGMALYDATTGERLALNTDVLPALAESGPLPMMFDEATNEVRVVTTDGLVTVNGATLEPHWTADVPVYREGPPFPGQTPVFDARIVTHPVAQSLYVYEYSAQRPRWLCHHAALVALDSGKGTRRAAKRVTTADGTPLCGNVEFVVTVAPARPAKFRVEVSGHRVTLSWDRPPEATHYEVEAGSAPGLRDLLRVVPNAIPLVVDNVPSGTYCVRVRALNYAGKGAYTDDLTIVVP